MKKTVVLLAALLVLALAPLAHADSYVGVYGGYAFYQDTDIELNGVTEVTNAELDSGGLVGGKLGWWAKTLPWVAVEVNVWNNWTGPADSDANLNLLNFSGSLLLQYVMSPLRLYAGGGVVGCWADFGVEDDSQSSLNVGAMGQAGVEWEIVPHWGVFGEYRYVYMPLEFDDVEHEGVTAEFNADRSEVIGGLNFRF
jgi:opacity protein-like surface antigen